MSELQQQLSMSQSLLTTSNEQLQCLTVELGEKNRRVDQLQSELAQEHAKSDQMANENESKVATLANEVTLLQSQLIELQKTLAAHSDESAEFTRRLSDNESALEASKNEVDRLTNELDATRGQLQMKQDESVSASSQFDVTLSELKVELSTTKSALETSSLKVDELSNELAESHRIIASKEVELTAAHASLDQLRHDLVTLQEQQHTLHNTSTSMKGERQEGEADEADENDDDPQTSDEKENDHVRVRETVPMVQHHQLQAELGQVQSHLNDLQSQLHARDTQLHALRAEIDTKDSAFKQLQLDVASKDELLRTQLTRVSQLEQQLSSSIATAVVASGASDVDPAVSDAAPPSALIDQQLVADLRSQLVQSQYALSLSRAELSAAQESFQTQLTSLARELSLSNTANEYLRTQMTKLTSDIECLQLDLTNTRTTASEHARAATAAKKIGQQTAAQLAELQKRYDEISTAMSLMQQQPQQSQQCHPSSTPFLNPSASVSSKSSSSSAARLRMSDEQPGALVVVETPLVTPASSVPSSRKVSPTNSPAVKPSASLPTYMVMPTNSNPNSNPPIRPTPSNPAIRPMGQQGKRPVAVKNVIGNAVRKPVQTQSQQPIPPNLDPIAVNAIQSPALASPTTSEMASTPSPTVVSAPSPTPISPSASIENLQVALKAARTKLTEYVKLLQKKDTQLASLAKQLKEARAMATSAATATTSATVNATSDPQDENSPPSLNGTAEDANSHTKVSGSTSNATTLGGNTATADDTLLLQPLPASLSRDLAEKVSPTSASASSVADSDTADLRATVSSLLAQLASARASEATLEYALQSSPYGMEGQLWKASVVDRQRQHAGPRLTRVVKLVPPEKSILKTLTTPRKPSIEREHSTRPNLPLLANSGGSGELDTTIAASVDSSTFDPDMSGIALQGFLVQKPSTLDVVLSVSVAWLPRYGVLRHDRRELTIYSILDEFDQTLQEVARLSLDARTSVRHASEAATTSLVPLIHTRPNSFEVKTSTGTRIQLACANASEAAVWVDALLTCVARANVEKHHQATTAVANMPRTGTRRLTINTSTTPLTPSQQSSTNRPKLPSTRTTPIETDTNPTTNTAALHHLNHYEIDSPKVEVHWTD